MTDWEGTNGSSSICFWWRHHFDRRYFTILPRKTDDCTRDCVMDDYGNLVRVS